MSKKKNNLNYIPASAKTAAQKKDEAKHSKRENLSPEARAKLIKKRAWTLSVISLSLVLVLTLSILFASYTPTYYNEKTNKPPVEDTDTSVVKNDEFGLSQLLYNGAVSDALQFPYTPEGWTLTSTTTDKSVAGVVSRDADDKNKAEKDLKGANVADADLEGILKNTDATNATDDKDVLLMYNKTSTNMRAYSSSFTVSANSYMEISVRVRTGNIVGDGAFVSNKTSASDSKAAELSYTGIKDADWTEYKFLIEGSKTSSKTLYLFVGLGTSDSGVKGWAEFDFAKAETTKKSEYITIAESDPKPANLKTKSYVENASEDNSFDSVFGANNVMSDSQGNPLTPKMGDEAEYAELPFYNKSALEVYKLENAAGGKASEFMSLTQQLTVGQSTASPYYRLSFWAKTEDIKLETGAYFYARLVGDDGSVSNAQISLVSTSEEDDDVNNGWEEFSFLFKPDNTQGYKAEIVFALGQLVYDAKAQTYKPAISNVETTGKLHVTEFELKEIFPSEYNSASAGSNLAKASLTSSTSTGLITNGSFDSPIANASVSSGNVPAGYDPNGWNISIPRVNGTNGYEYAPHTADDLVFGVVPNNASNKADYLGANASDFFNHTGKDNVLAVNVKKDTAIGFVSNTFSLAANNQYVISVMVKASADAKVNVYLTGDVKQSFALSNIASDKYYVLREFVNGGYTQYNFVIKTGDVAKSVALELWVGSKDATKTNDGWTGLATAGTVVAFDEAVANSITAEQFKNIVEDKDGDNDIFVKTETKEYIKDEDGNDTNKQEIVEVTYTTEKQNVWVRDFSYVDNTGAVEDDGSNDEETPEETVVAPVDWLMLSSLILSIAVIIFLVAMIAKKFKKVQKVEATPEDPDYKK